MSDMQSATRPEPEADLSTLRLERRADGRIWLTRDGDNDPWYEAAVQAAKQAKNEGQKEGEKKTVDTDSTADGVAVRIAPCFPWSRTRQYISVRTFDGKELVLIPSLDALADETRRLVEAALAEIGFVLEMTRVLEIRTEVEIRNWRVETKQGPCTFQTKLDEWPHPLPDGTFVLRDVAGNLFLIPDPKTLDSQSRKLLWPFVG